MNSIMSGLISANYSIESLKKLTVDRAVAGLPFGSRYRLIDFPLSNMVNSGIRTIGLITPHFARSFFDHVRTGKEWSLDRKSGGMFVLPGSVYGIRSMDSKFPLRDISMNRIFLTRETAPYIVISCSNIVYNTDFRPMLDFHIKSGTDITMAYNCSKTVDPRMLSLTMDENKKVTDLRKGGLNTQFLDCFIISRDLLLMMLDWYASLDYLDIFDIIRDNLDKMDVRGYQIDGYFGNVATMQDYFHRNMDLLKEDVRNELFMGENKVITKAMDSFPSRYLHSSSVKNSLIPTGCIIGGRLENSILCRGVVIEEGAVVKNSILLQRVRIRAGAVVENAILDKDTVIEPNNVVKGTSDNPLVR